MSAWGRPPRLWLAGPLERSPRYAGAVAAGADAIALLLIVAVGTEAGRNSVDSVMGAIGLGGLPWDKYFGGFDTLVAATAPVFWMFFLLTGYSLLLLRAKDRDIQRPFSCAFYPLEPILFCGMCHFMLFSAIDYAGGLSLLGLVPLRWACPCTFSQWAGPRPSWLKLRTSTSEASASDHVGRPFRAVQGRPGRADLQPAAKLDSSVMTFGRQEKRPAKRPPSIHVGRRSGPSGVGRGRPT